MISNSLSDKPVGVIGAGNFGTVIANILAINRPVLLYARNGHTVKHINHKRENRHHAIHSNITAVNDLAKIARECDVIFPMVPSAHFRAMMKSLSPFLQPYHILIHGTKGFDVTLPEGETIDSMPVLDRNSVKTMSEVIREESVVVRIGCLAGPNLSKELAQRQPAATVIASHFDEVIQTGKKLLRNDRFQVYENHDIVGVEIAGVLKNIIAIAAGALSGLGYGENAKGLLVSRGAVEMIYLGRALGGDVKAFLGVAGIGDLVTTCNSPLSRNFTVGYRLAKGEKLDDILNDMGEIAEGVNTIQIAKKCADHYKIRALITDRLYKVLFEGMTVEAALDFLMRFPLSADIDFI
ncbi:MAG: NAD(P)-dependent glycerol-3-phosphate dehydrogenase [Cytophagales bacterium]|jgi:glycerol-3-phosphate dehydrogenase (NAD(P)+)|nr:NAD(P)-dependent glycerol-3-phosphate dehydrogenase [Cytophagales bacterium]MCA6389334.1 NAD(P)-dependent glycerol-3-phosphate dehydrogenase [Cytophagales bacterium]MCA6393076.1 NAD(P)-dependent glycerol-3-phosphate dehydrogenase [Cytophagales bacterium]MCA6396752.1 NAD(P)-dependent glycerol-3-phosphate dehydrogenase [Cytophagales bacterium]MCA6400383.1 NAD(P)-dependent glycerol-3-phosphate dehydrogenase [Cytophagales bacterium]